MRNLVKYIFVIILSVFSFVQPLSIFACGMSLIPSTSGWSYGNDSAEQSFINYENGEEKLIISRDFTNGSKNTVWIIPIPSKPTEIKTDIISELPQYSGYNVREKAQENLSIIRDTILSTQIYPIFPLMVLHSIMWPPVYDTNLFPPAGAASGARLGGANFNVSVYSHLEKEGMIAEVLSATASDDLYNYLHSKGLSIEKDSLPIFQDYIGKDFAFVASWISPSANTEARKGLQMTFPTQNIFYPLKPGSVYPGEGLPETITVVGHVTPKLYDNIKDATTVNYFYSDHNIDRDEFSQKINFGFTKIVIDTEPKKMNEDLYIDPSTPLTVQHANIVSRFSWPYGIGILLVSTVIATIVALNINSLQLSSWSQFGFFVIINSLTIIGTAISSRVFLTQKRIAFLLTYTIFFCISSIALTLLLSLLLP